MLNVLPPVYAHAPGSLDAYPIGCAPGEAEAFSAALARIAEKPYRWTNEAASPARTEHLARVVDRLYPIRYPMSFARMDIGT